MQSKTASFAESITQTMIGYALATATQAIVFPLYGLKVTLFQNMQMGLIFMAVSIARGYVVRRWFNR